MIRVKTVSGEIHEFHSRPSVGDHSWTFPTQGGFIRFPFSSVLWILDITDTENRGEVAEPDGGTR